MPNIEPDLTVKGNPGYCLKLVGDVFHTKDRPFASATEAWNGAKYKHPASEPLPEDRPVVVFYSWNGKPTPQDAYGNWGDVAINIPNKGVFGSPKASDGYGSRFDHSVEERRAWLGGGAQYLGWTEDINGIRISEPGGTMPDFKELAVRRQEILQGIAKIVIPDLKGEVDGNSYPQVVANIKQLYKQNDDVTKIAEDRLERIKELEKGNVAPTPEQIVGGELVTALKKVNSLK